MGLFDKMTKNLKGKMSNLAGKHGVTVTATEIERQTPDANNPAAVQFPITDSVVKGRFTVQGEKEVTILSHTVEVYAAICDETGEDNEREILLASDTVKEQIIGSDLAFPYVLQPGQTIEDSFCVIEVDVVKALEELEYDDEDEALGDDSLYLFVRIIADVKGTPMDAETEVEMALAPGVYDDNVDDEVDDVDVGTDDIAASREAGIRLLQEPLSPRPYLDRFNAMAAELEARDDIVVDTYVARPGATDEDIAAAKAYSPISDDMERFYRQANGLTLHWHLKDNEETCGRIDLKPLDQVFSDWRDCIYFDDDDDFKPLHPVDFFVDEACAALYVDGSANPTVYYHYCGEEMDTLAVDFGQYLELLLKTRGFWYWQTALSTDLKGVSYTTSPGLFRRGMRELFAADYDEQFFFRNDYEAEDMAKHNARKAQVDKLKNALEQEGVSFGIKAEDEGYIYVALDDNTANFAKAKTALSGVGFDFDLDGDWGMKSVGEVMVERR